MRDIGFVISAKENERRRALVPGDLRRVDHPEHLVFETGYGLALGLDDDAYRATGARIVDREEAWSCPVVCAMKTPRADEIALLHEGQTVFGWLHAVQNREIADLLVDNRMTGIAWEDMFEGSRHVFQRNNQLTGEAGVMHAILQWGRLVQGLDAAVIGCGNVGGAAAVMLDRLGARVTVYRRGDEAVFRRDLGRFDMIVNAVLWDVRRRDRLLYRDDLARLRFGAAILDLSCDENLEIETSRSTTIEDPVYYVDGILHYVVDHVPALVWQTASESISREVAPYVDALVDEREDNVEVLRQAVVVREGDIVDKRIIEFQGR